MRLESHFESKQICFYFIFGKVFQLPEFQAKLFFKRNWVVGSERDSHLSNVRQYDQINLCVGEFKAVVYILQFPWLSAKTVGNIGHFKCLENIQDHL